MYLSDLVWESINRRVYDYTWGIDLDPDPIELYRSSWGVRRSEWLREVWNRVTSGHSRDADRLRWCVTFCQCHFFHHLIRQPLLGSVMCFDPLVVFEGRVARCGQQSRFLVDLLIAGGIDARLLVSDRHTAVVARIDGEWVIADSDLYPPGIQPNVTLRQAIDDPSCLDVVPSYVNHHAGYLSAYSPSMVNHATPTPSSAFMSTLRMARKYGGPGEWDSDLHYGWTNTEMVLVSSPDLPWRFRPRQLQPIVTDGDLQLPGEPVRIHVGEVGWSYDRLLVHNEFILPRCIIETEEPSIPVALLRELGPLAIVVPQSDVWCLPSSAVELQR